MQTTETSNPARRLRKAAMQRSGSFLMFLCCLSGTQSGLAQTGSCENERQAVIRLESRYASMTDGSVRQDVRDRVFLPSSLFGNRGCPAGAGRFYENPVRDAQSPEFRQALLAWAGCADAWAQDSLGKGHNREEATALLHKACVARQMAAEMGRGGSPGTAAGGQPASPSPANQPSQASANPALQAQLDLSLQLAARRQSEVDRARAGKPKKHVVAREAHNCLRPQKGGGVINDCPYAVEYSYCVLRPERNSWSESFTCGKSMGSWQIGPGPNSRAIMHTAGEATYWFACRYGESLGKPDGVSPVDLEYQAGRGILGRCAEWGTGSRRS